MADGSIGSASRRLLLIAAMGVLVFLVAWTGLLLTRFNGYSASIWLANAVAVAILLRSPKRRWPELIAAAVAANIAARIVNGDAAVHGLTLALVNMIEVLIVVVTMRRHFGPDLALGEVQLHGRQGSFVLQHSGSMNRGAQQLSVTVVPDSGTDELTGLSGKLDIKIADGKHFYEFEYVLAKTP